MVGDSSQESSLHVHTSRQREFRQESSIEQVASNQSMQSSSLAQSAAFLGRSRLGRRGNGPVRAATMRAMRSTHGNRAVQRFVSNGALALPVQRVPEPQLPSEEEEEKAEEPQADDEPVRDLGDVDQLNQPARDMGDADSWFPDSNVQPEDIQQPDHYPDPTPGPQPKVPTDPNAVGDAARSVAWDVAGVFGGPAATVAATTVDAYKAGTAYAAGDEAAYNKAVDDAKLDALGIIPGVGTALSAGSAVVDAVQLGQRLNGATSQEAPTVGDYWQRASEFYRENEKSLPPQNPFGVGGPAVTY